MFSLPHPLEVELSELISQTIPHAEMVKFEKTGSNVVTGAVRAARYITKKNKIAYCGSGGVWHDWWAAVVSRDGGIPEFNRNEGISGYHELALWMNIGSDASTNRGFREMSLEPGEVST